ncbi:MAG: VanZ family protein [Candidatus Udaeobacter sp.]
MRVFLKYCLPLLVWLALIFIDSTDLMSAEHTSRFIVPFLLWLKPDISPETVASVHFFIRKFAHVGEYAILALLLFRAAICVTNLKWSMSILCVSIWSICLVVAATDEFHQTFVRSRGPSVRDIMIDSGGAIVGLLVGAVLAKKRSTKIRQNGHRATKL